MCHAVIILGETGVRTMLSHVEFLVAHPPMDCVRFGNVVFYAEVQFFRRLDSGSTETIGLFWLPELFCLGKPYFSDANYSGVLEMLKATFVVQGYRSLYGKETNDIAHASQALKPTFSGNIVVTETRSDCFSCRYPVAQWKICGLSFSVITD